PPSTSTLSLHDALPISNHITDSDFPKIRVVDVLPMAGRRLHSATERRAAPIDFESGVAIPNRFGISVNIFADRPAVRARRVPGQDRKSTRLNSSHQITS